MNPSSFLFTFFLLCLGSGVLVTIIAGQWLHWIAIVLAFVVVTKAISIIE